MLSIFMIYMVHLNELTGKIIGCAIEVHKGLGPGLLGSAYQECLFYKLNQAGLYVEKEKPMPLVFEEIQLECGYRIDLMVETKVTIEVKAVEKFNDVHLAQIMTYMKLADVRIGLLINFNVFRLNQGGIKRVII